MRRGRRTVSAVSSEQRSSEAVEGGCGLDRGDCPLSPCVRRPSPSVLLAHVPSVEFQSFLLWLIVVENISSHSVSAENQC